MQRTWSRLVLLAAAACLLSGAVTLGGGPAATAAEAARPDAQQWGEDLQYFARILPQGHKNLFFRLPRAEFERRLAALEPRLGGLTDAGIYVELARIVAAVGDSHTTLVPTFRPRGVLVKFQWFADGIYPVKWDPRGRDLAGGRLVGIGDRPVDEVLRELSLLVSHDNEAGLKQAVPSLLNNYDLLVAAGLIPDTGTIRYWVEDAQGAKRAVDLAAGTVDSDAGFAQAYTPKDGQVPLYLKRNDWFWFEVLPEEEALYIQYNRCWDRKLQQAVNPSDPNLGRYPDFDAFTASVLKALAANPVRTIILDLRNNGGGSSLMGTRFIKTLAAQPKVKAGAKIVGLIGRRTFSSALINAVDLKTRAKARLYGEPTSGKPNHYGEVKSFTLPNSGWRVNYSTKHFRLVKGDPDSLYPDVQVEGTYRDYVEGRDPVLEAVFRDYPAAV